MLYRVMACRGNRSTIKGHKMKHLKHLVFALTAIGTSPVISYAADVTGERLKIGTNHVLNGTYATIGGGQNNTNNAVNAVISGGSHNAIGSNGLHSVIAGGSSNLIQNPHGFIGTGWGNMIL